MKKLLLALAVLVCLPASAAIRHLAKPIDHGFTKVSPEFLANVINHPHPRTGRLMSNVSTEGGDNSFIIAIVGSAPGSGGTFFRSTTTFVNNDPNFSQNIIVIFFDRNNPGGCGSNVAKTITLPAFSWVTYQDVLNDLLGVSNALGSLVVIGVDGAGNFDSSANIDGYSRIFTPIFFSGQQFGTASQSFAPVSLSAATGTQSAYGLQYSASFRMNYGIFNYATNIGGARSFLVRVYGTDGTLANETVNVNQCSLWFNTAPFANFPNGFVILDITPSDGEGFWYGFGSSVDNVSGDNWSSPTRP